MTRLLRFACLPALAAFALLACTTSPDQDEAGSSTTEDEQESSTTQDETSDATTDESTTGVIPDPCECEGDQLCVGTCVISIGLPVSAEIKDLQCIDPEPCEEGIDTPACRMAACGSATYEVLDSCESLPVGGYDVLCSNDSLPGACDPIAQDCPEGQKCVGQVSPDEFDVVPVQCVDIEGNAGIGEPCSSEGNIPGATDTCDETGICWNGTALSAEPFEGVCQPFCFGEFECPEGLSCELVDDDLFNLCV